MAIGAHARRADDVGTGIGCAAPIGSAAFPIGAVFVIAIDNALATNAAAAIAIARACAIHSRAWVGDALRIKANFATLTTENVAVIAIAKRTGLVALAGDSGAKINTGVIDATLGG